MAEISPENSPESCLETSEFTPIPADIDDSDAYEDDQ